MIIKTTKMSDISDITPSATGCFIAGSLCGGVTEKTKKDRAVLTLLVRLIDKAIYEYSTARELTINEEIENKMTYEEITSRDSGQYLFFVPIINHLENCLNSIRRIYLLLEIINDNTRTRISGNIVNVRNLIEHMEAEIEKDIRGSISLNISEDALTVEINGLVLKLDDLAFEIRNLYKKIIKLLGGNKKSSL